MEKRRKILLAEDEALNAMYLKMVLKKAGFEIQNIAATGEEAISMVRGEKPDIIIMDVRLAGEMDGIDTAAQIKSSSNIPIIFMTGYPDKEHMERAKKTNPAGYFIKPVPTQDLVSAINKVIEYE